MREKIETDRIEIDLENSIQSHKEGLRSRGSSLPVILTAENGIAALKFASRIIQYHLGITEYDELFGNKVFLKLKPGTVVHKVEKAEERVMRIYPMLWISQKNNIVLTKHFHYLMRHGIFYAEQEYTSLRYFQRDVFISGNTENLIENTIESFHNKIGTFRYSERKTRENHILKGRGKGHEICPLLQSLSYFHYTNNTVSVPTLSLPSVLSFPSLLCLRGSEFIFAQRKMVTFPKSQQEKGTNIIQKISKNCLNQATYPQMSKAKATVFVAAGSLLTGFANCIGLGCNDSLSNCAGGILAEQQIHANPWQDKNNNTVTHTWNKNLLFYKRNLSKENTIGSFYSKIGTFRYFERKTRENHILKGGVKRHKICLLLQSLSHFHYTNCAVSVPTLSLPSVLSFPSLLFLWGSGFILSHINKTVFSKLQEERGNKVLQQTIMRYGTFYAEQTYTSLHYFFGDIFISGNTGKFIENTLEKFTYSREGKVRMCRQTCIIRVHSRGINTSPPCGGVFSIKRADIGKKKLDSWMIHNRVKIDLSAKNKIKFLKSKIGTFNNIERKIGENHIFKSGLMKREVCPLSLLCLRGSRFILAHINKTIFPKSQQEKGNKVLQQIIRKENQYVGIRSVRDRRKYAESLAEDSNYIEGQSREQHKLSKRKVGYEGYAKRYGKTSVLNINKDKSNLSQTNITKVIKLQEKKGNSIIQRIIGKENDDLGILSVRDRGAYIERLTGNLNYTERQSREQRTLFKGKDGYEIYAGFPLGHTFSLVNANLVRSILSDQKGKYTKKEECGLNQSVFTAFDQMGKQEKVFVRKNAFSTGAFSQITKYIRDWIAAHTKNIVEEREQKIEDREMADRLENRIHQQGEQIKNLMERLQEFEKLGDGERNGLLGEEKYFYIFENDLTLEQMRYGIK